LAQLKLDDFSNIMMLLPYLFFPTGNPHRRLLAAAPFLPLPLVSIGGSRLPVLTSLTLHPAVANAGAGSPT
jgi:hypothetical protein